MAIGDNYARDTHNLLATDNPDEIPGVEQMLEAKLDETLDSITSIDAKMCELREERAKCIDSLYETTSALLEKCDVATQLINSARVSSQNY